MTHEPLFAIQADAGVLWRNMIYFFINREFTSCKKHNFQITRCTRGFSEYWQFHLHPNVNLRAIPLGFHGQQIHRRSHA